MRLDDRAGGSGVPEGFLELPALIYRDDSMWIPEEPAAVERAFGADNPWFAAGRAHAFCVPGQVRAAVFHDPSAAIDGEPVAYFGYWESAGQGSAAAAVMREVEAWAREQGAATLYGPIDFTTFGRYRLRLSAEPGGVTFPGEPYNPPSYPRQLEELGFSPRRRYVTQVTAIPRGQRERKRGALDSLLREGYRVETLTPGVWMARLPELHRLADSIFGDNFAYAPIPYAAFAAAYGTGVARCFCRRSSVIAYAPGGEIAGVFLVFPHYGPLLVQGAGAARVAPGELDHDTHLPLLHAYGPLAAIAKTVGVHPAHRRKGLFEALTVAMFDLGEGCYDSWLCALIREDNPSRRFADAEKRAERWYGLYAKRLDERRGG